MICNKCNHTLPDDSEFCQYCGNRLETTDKTDMHDMPDFENMSSEDALKTIFEIHTQETRRAMEANKQKQPNNEGNADFGLVPEKPIYTLAIKSVDGEEEYLNKLYTVNGEKIKWNRRGSTGVDGIYGIIDIYDTYLPSGQFYKTIYINMYGARTSAAAPQGFVLCSKNATANKNITTTRRNNFFQNRLNSVISTISMVLSAVAILSIVIALFTKDDSQYSTMYLNLTAVYVVFLLLFSAFIAVECIAKKQNNFKWAIRTAPILAFFASIAIIGYLFSSEQFYGYFDYHFKHINNYGNNISNVLFIILCFIIPLINSLPVIDRLAAKYRHNYYSSIKYREKCYKKVALMKEYLDNGIITEEEFEKNKQEILKHIKF